VRPLTWIGTAHDVAERILAFRDAGFDEAILGLNPPYGEATTEMLGEVADRVRG